MNDNMAADSPNHAYALALLNDLMIILANMDKRGLDAYDEKGDPIFCPGFWSDQCALALNVKKVA